MRNLSSNSKIPARSKSPAKITITYFIISALWILFSDMIVRRLVSDPDSIILISMIKGWFFIVVTSLLIFYLIRRELFRIEKLNDELYESNRVFAAFTDSTHEKIWSSDLSGRFTFVNEAACQMFGLRAQDILGKSFLEFTAPESIEISNNALASIYEDDRLSLLEHTALSASGVKTALLTNAVLLRNSTGEPYEIMGTSLDITDRKESERKLSESEAKFRGIVETANEGIMILDGDQVITFANNKMAAEFGYELDEFIGLTAFDLVFDEQIVLQKINDRKEGLKDRFEIQHKRKDGSPFWVSVSASPILDQNGAYKGSLIMQTDINTRKLNEIELKKNEEKYRNLVETSHGIVWTIDANSRITFISEGCYDIIGFRPDELIGKKFTFTDRKQYISFFREMINARQTGNKGQFESVFWNKLTGKQLDFFNHVVFKYDEQGKLESIVGNSVDVSDLKEQQDIISRSEQKYRNLVEASQGLIWTINKDGVIEFINKNAVEFYGIEAHDLIGRNFVDFFTPSNKMKMLEDFSGLLGSKDLNNYTSEYELLHPDGKTVNVISSGVLLRDKDGNVTGITGTSIDITERKEAEEALRKSEEKYHVIFESTGTATMIVEEDTTISMANNECTILTGYSAGELIGRKWTEFVAPESLEEMMKNHLLRRSNPAMAPSKYEVKLINCKGETRNAMLDIGTIPETKQSIVSIVDITELKLASKALRESEEKYRKLLEASQGLIWLIDEEGKFTYISKSAIDYYGIEAADMIGRSTFEFHKPETIEATKELLNHIFATGEASPDLEEYTIYRPDGKVVYIAERSVVVRNSEGKVTGLMGTSFDITESKKTAEKIKESEERYRELTEASQGLIWIINEEGRFTYVSSSAKDYYGIEASELIGRKAFDFHNPESVEQAEVNLKRIFSTGENTNTLQEDVINRPDGKVIYLIERSVVVKNSEGKVIGLMGTSLDVTERKLAEKAMKEYNEQIELLYNAAQKLNLTLNISEVCRTIFESVREITPVDSLTISSYDEESKLITYRGYWIDNKELDISAIPPIPLGEGVQSTVIMSGEAEVVTDYQQRIKKNRNIYYLGESGELTENEPNEADTIKSAIVVPLKVKGKVTGVMQIFSLKENSYTEEQLRFVESLSNYVSVAQQNALLYAEVNRELDDRKLAEEALRISEDKYRTIVETANEGIWSVDETGRVVFANQKSAEMLGYDVKEMIGKELFDFMYEEDYDLVRGNLEKRKKGVPGSFEFQYRKKDGSPTWAFVSVSPMFDSAGKYYGSLSMITDINEWKAAQVALKEREYFFRESQRAANVGSYKTDFAKGVWESSEVLDEIFGIDKDYNRDVPGWLNIIHADDRELMNDYLINEVIAKRKRFDKEYRITRNSDKQTRWLYGLGEVEFDSDGNILSMIGTIQDITERKKVEDSLKESEEKYRTLVETTPFGIRMFDTEMNIVFANRASLNMQGYESLEEAKSHNAVDIVPDEQRHLVSGLYDEIVRKGIIKDRELTYMRKDGTTFEGEFSGSVLRNSAGEVSGVITVTQDITERKYARRAIEESENRYRTLVETAPFGIRMFDMENKLLFANTETLRLHGYDSLEELKGRSLIEFVAEESKDDAARNYEDIIKMGVVRNRAITYLCKDGSKFEGEFSATLLRDSDGNPSNVISVVQDVTERKELETKLKQSEAYYRALIETSPFAIGVTNLEGIIVFGNNKLAEMHGYKNMEEFPSGTRVFDLLSESTRELGLEHFYENMKAGSIEQLELTLTRKDGCEFPAELTTSVLKDGSGNPTALLAVIQDITERKRIESLLKESELYYRTLVETSPFAIGVTDMEGKILFGNKKAAEMHGFEDVDEIAPGLTLFDFIAPAERDKAVEYFEENLKTGSIVAKELNFVKKDGSEFPVEITASVLLDSSQRPTAIMSIIQDITERKRIEGLLKESELYYRTLTDTLPVGIVLLDLNGEATYYSEPVKQMLHFPGGFVALGQNYLERVVPEHRGAAMERMMKVITTGDFTNTMFDYELLRFDDTTFWANTNTAPYTDVNGNLVGVLVVIQDITEKRKMEVELFENKEKLSAVLSAAMDTIIVTDESMRILFFNTAAESLLKCSYAYALGKNIDEFIPKILLEPEIKGSGISRKTHKKKVGTSYSFEWVARAMDGTEIPVEASFSTADIMGKEFYTVIIRDITARLKSENEIKKVNENLRSLAAHLQKIREEERMLIARDIHDQLGQDLTALKMDIVMLSKDIGKKNEFPDQQPVIGELHGMAELADKTIKWVRKLSTELRPDVLDKLGLLETIEWHASEFEKRTGIECSVSIAGDDSLLSKEQAIVLFRILQESLTNVMRHSGAGKVKISFKEKREGYSFSVEDNGTGFAAGNIEGKGSLGLIGMKERAYTLGGSVDIVSVPGKGTSVNVTIPKTNQNSNG